jgi:protein-S-isoprenylcysteine O-methyltransferase Ste14
MTCPDPRPQETSPADSVPLARSTRVENTDPAGTGWIGALVTGGEGPARCAVAAEQGLLEGQRLVPAAYGSWYGAVIFALLDAVRLRWSTIDPALSLVQYVGVLLVALGLIVRIVARLTLGKAFSPVVQTADAHRLVSAGIYSSIRHPAYLGTLCLLIGFPVCSGSLIGLGIALVAGVPALIYRIHVEEQALRAWFGEVYEAYSEGTSRLIPYVW